jgi:hypothetical protein
MQERPKRRGRLTYANVMSTLAVFLVLGGGAYAATRLPKNSVGTKQLKNGSITLAKLSASAREALKGATGPQGAPGAPGATKVIIRTGVVEEGRSVASCQAGEVATGGGGVVDPEEQKSWIWNSTPVQLENQVPTSWEVDGENAAGEPSDVEAYVICASP